MLLYIHSVNLDDLDVSSSQIYLWTFPNCLTRPKGYDTSFKSWCFLFIQILLIDPAAPPYFLVRFQDERPDKIAKICCVEMSSSNLLKGFSRPAASQDAFQLPICWVMAPNDYHTHTTHKIRKQDQINRSARLDLGWPRNADGTRTTSKSRTTGRGKMSDSRMTRVKRVTTVVQLGFSG